MSNEYQSMGFYFSSLIHDVLNCNYFIDSRKEPEVLETRLYSSQHLNFMCFMIVLVVFVLLNPLEIIRRVPHGYYIISGPVLQLRQ